jgi:hypothetical protein
MSIAKLTGESLSDMSNRNNAPKIYATILQKPNFSNTDGFPEGKGVIPQVCAGFHYQINSSWRARVQCCGTTL